jgi:helix-turn-helix protein
MKASDVEQTLKAQLARELCALVDGYPREIGAMHLGTHPTELSRLRQQDLRRFSLQRLLRFAARSGHDIEVHLKTMPRLEERPQPRHHPTSTVIRFDYYGRATGV